MQSMQSQNSNYHLAPVNSITSIRESIEEVPSNWGTGNGLNQPAATGNFNKLNVTDYTQLGGGGSSAHQSPSRLNFGASPLQATGLGIAAQSPGRNFN